MKSNLEHKTIRPGHLTDYSFYYSKRNAPQPDQQKPPRRNRSGLSVKILLIVLLAGAGFVGYQQTRQAEPVSSQEVTQKSAAAAKPAPPPKNECADNGYDKFVKISISQRKLWGCEGNKTVHSTSVITGIEKYAATETPLGTYKIYAKQADTVLTGSDEVGSWRYPVSYWMPFLDNQYGTYGFHDATWRKPSEFGNINPYTSEKASHGCIELPLTSMKWLFEWAPPGTVLTVVA